MLRILPDCSSLKRERQIMHSNWQPLPTELLASHQLIGEATATHYDYALPDQLARAAKITQKQRAAYFLTANSALPLAHSIRGYHDHAELPTPLITHVSANYRAFTVDPPEVADQELQRLRDYIRSNAVESAIIVDENVRTGRVLRYGSQLLIQAGIHKHNLHQIAGKWYDQATYGDEPPLQHIHIGPTEQPVAVWLYMLGQRAAASTLEHQNA